MSHFLLLHVCQVRLSFNFIHYLNEDDTRFQASEKLRLTAANPLEVRIKYCEYRVRYEIPE